MSRMMRGPLRLLAILPTAFLGVFWAWPMLAVARQAARGEALAWALRPYLADRLGVALQQAGASLLLAALAAAALVAVHRRRVRGQRLLWALHAAPFALPVFVVVPGLKAALPLDALPALWAVAAANAYYNAGLAALLVHQMLAQRSVRLEEAAAILGAPHPFWRVGARLVAPGVAAVAALVLLFSLQSFGVVHYLGQGEVDSLETVLYANLAGGFPRPERAAVVALLQVAVCAGLLAAQARLARRVPHDREAMPAAPAGPVRSALAWVLAAAWVAPIGAVLAQGFRLRGQWTLAPWRAILDEGAAAHLAGFELGRALAWSATYAAASVAVALVLALALAAALRCMGRLRPAAEALAALPLGTSSLVVGTALATAFVAGLGPLGRGSPAFVVAAHALVAFPLAARLLLPALDAVPIQRDQAAQMLGASPLSVLRRLHLRDLRAPLVAAGAVGAALSLGDFGASLLLSRGDSAGLGLWIHRHGPLAFNPMARAQAAALAGLLALLTLPLAAAAAWPRREA